ncbi:unnamed protein product [Microthlaspi erraticum]|uniref:Glycosyl transferase family 1 domain-containing protein n=1 Tax=Microthlaspi erraticum TaxID=1685480 RepID=A0A6D2LBQ6_9BRAS|nr:unnamed protein product [Microthlaspi erraticum]
MACNSGGHVSTVKTGVTGYLCEPTPEGFSKAMAKFIGNSELAGRMGTEARKHVVYLIFTKTLGQRLISCSSNSTPWMYPRITTHTPGTKRHIAVRLSFKTPACLSRCLVKPPTMDWGKRTTFIYPTSNKHQHQARGSTRLPRSLHLTSVA